MVESDTLYDKRRITGGKLPLQMLEVYKPVYAHLPLDTLKIAMEFKLPPPEGISLGNGVRVNGGTFSGLDLLQVFTREFWQFRKKRMRTRTMGVLEEYRKQR